MNKLVFVGVGFAALVAAACGSSTVSFPTPDAGGGGAGGDGPGGAGPGGAGSTGGAGSGGSVGTGGAPAVTSTGGAGGSGGSAPVCTDADKDGSTDCDGDCDDADPTTYPGAPEICGDGVDNACTGNAGDAASCMGIGTYVSTLIGNDNNPGTKALPVVTIKKGIANAQALGGAQPVFVAQGTYAENVDLVEAIDLQGGYHCASQADCDWSFDPKTHVATIQNIDDNGVFAGHSISNATEVEGFTVTGRSTNNVNNSLTAAFTIQGAPVIRGNIITGGAVTNCGNFSCGSRAIALSGAPATNDVALIKRNVIKSGDSTHSSIAVQIGNGSKANIDGNDIQGGKGNWPRAIAVGGGSGAVTIVDNDVHAGACNGNNTTFAIAVGAGQTPLIDGNRINLDANKVGACAGFVGRWWTGGIESDGGVPTIVNNVIGGVVSPRSTAVLLADCEGICSLGSPIVVNNTLAGGGSNTNNAISAGIVFKNFKLGMNPVMGRVRNNILIGGSAPAAYGAYEDSSGANGDMIGTAKPEYFENNDLFGATTLYRAWNGTAAVLHTTTAAIDSQVNNANANLSVDPMLDKTGHIAATSGCIDKGTQSGGDTPKTDMDGEARPLGNEVDIGADEAK